MASRLTGQSIERVEDGRLLTGQGRFVGGMNKPGLLHAVFARSPIAHARLASIDTARALATPGVVAVFTGDDIAAAMAMPMAVMGPPSLKTAPYWPVARGKVRVVGDPVAIVVAECAGAAADGVDALDVTYEALPALSRLEDALDPTSVPLWDEVGTNVLADDTFTYGQPFADVASTAARTIKRSYAQHRYGHAPIEPRAAVAEYESFARTLRYDMANKRPHSLKMGFANLLGIPFPQVHVRSGDIGGAFGSKGQTSREDIALGAVAKLLPGRPIKWVETRTENLQAAGQAREENFDLEAAVDETGRIVGLRAHMTIDVGAYPMLPFPQTLWPSIVRMLLPNALKLDSYEFRATVVATNKGSYIAYRAPWLVETLGRERLLEDLAREVRLDPIEIRRRNLVGPEDQPRQMITGVSMNGVTVRGCMERAAELIDVPAFRARQHAARESGRLLGLGFSTFIENAPGPPDLPGKMGFDLPSETAWARIEPTGDVVIQTWQVNHGQGHETTLAQVVADEMGVPMSKVRIEWGSSDNTPFNTMSTGGSRSATMGAGSARMAARAVKKIALEIAAKLLEANAADLEIEDGDIFVRGTPTKKVTVPDVARVAWFAPSNLPEGFRQGIEAQVDFKVPDGAGWVSACHACIVAIDTETGHVEVERYLVVEDCGDLINPAIVDGQIRGGVIQGIAGTLFEKHTYDNEGQLLTSSFADYLVPASSDVPEIEIDHYHGPPLAEVNSRGVGEGGTLGTPAAVLNAIADAVAHLGVTFEDTHMSPNRVRDLIASAGTRAGI